MRNGRKPSQNAKNKHEIWKKLKVGAGEAKVIEESPRSHTKSLKDEEIAKLILGRNLKIFT